ncbi:MAG: hypothetical protein IKJ05_00560 [Oscillospiraceae bacterium]|nr:hypothetical protein [Oscillospiraceae bacterium]
MRKIISFILAVLIAVSMVACGQGAPAENKDIEIIRNRQPLKAEKLDLPLEIQGYKNVYLTDFDGQYAVFEIERERLIGKDRYVKECARIVVYDIVNKRTVHFANLDYPYGRVGGAVKDGDRLYYTVYYTADLKEELYVNDGLETRKLGEFVINSSADFSRLERVDDAIILTYNNGTFDNYNYRFDVLKDEKLEKAGEFKQKNPGFAEIEGYKDEKIIIRETEINDDGYIYFNRWTGEIKETVFKLADEHSHSCVQIDNMFIHPVDNPDNDGRYKMMAVTDIEDGNTTETGIVQGGFFGNRGNKAIMYQYGKSEEAIMMYEAGENTLTITPVEIDVSGKNYHKYFMTDDKAVLCIGVDGESDFELYLIEY